MKKRVFIVEGLAFLFIGVVFLFNSFSGLIGFVVLENVTENVSGILGLVFVAVGIVLMLAIKKIKSIDDVTDANGNKPEISNKFRKAIQGHPINKVAGAMEKIGSGKGNEEFLKHEKRWTVRSGESSYRIFYDRNPDGTYILTDYARQHK